MTHLEIQGQSFWLFQDDCLKQLKNIAANSIDSIVTDPPYGLSFMDKKWDYDVPSVEVWQECLRVLKPGGFLLSFAGTRTQHRMAVNIEDAGFEIRDMIAWVYGSGFPKSHNIGKAVDKLQGNEREVVGSRKAHDIRGNALMEATVPEYKKEVSQIQIKITKGTSEWEGWGTALKPALEPITVARKPFKGTVAANVLKWGTGGINIDGCRVGIEGKDDRSAGNRTATFGTQETISGGDGSGGYEPNNLDRFPANLIHDGSDEVVGLLGEQQRFFYCAKASKKDRGADNRHPTVKPTDLMRYLCRLVTRPGGTVLDPFMGSGSTGKACKLEGFNFVGIEREPEYIEIALARIKAAEKETEVQQQFNFPGGR